MVAGRSELPAVYGLASLCVSDKGEYLTRLYYQTSNGVYKFDLCATLLSMQIIQRFVLRYLM